MTDKQLFEAFGGVKEKYLSEMLDDEPQRALELRPVKRSPIKFTAMITAACLAVAGIAAGAVFVGKRGGISALMRGVYTVQGESISENCSVSLENIVLDDDWLKDYSSDYLDSMLSEHNLNELPKDFSKYMGRKTGNDFIPITADLKLTFSAWDILPNEQVMAQVQFFADGELIKYIPFKDPYYYHPETKYKQDDFDPIMLSYDVMGHLTLGKALADNASSDSEEKIYEFPVTFDVKKGTHQITAAVEFLSIDTLSSSFATYSEVLTRTYLIDDKTAPPDKTYTFAADTVPGYFSTEKAASENDTSLFTDDRTLTFGINKINSRNSFYLMVLMDGKPIECFNGKYSLMTDPKDTQNGFTFTIPKDLISQKDKTSVLRVLAIPIVDKKFNGVYAAPVTPRYYVTTNAKNVTENDQKNVRSVYEPDLKTTITMYTDKEIYKRGETVHVIAKVENLSDTPLRLKRYSTVDPTDTEEGNGVFTVEIEDTAFPDHGLRGAKNEPTDNLGPVFGIGTGAFYREAFIDTGKLPEDTNEYRIIMCYSPEKDGYFEDASVYIEIKVTE